MKVNSTPHPRELTLLKWGHRYSKFFPSLLPHFLLSSSYLQEMGVMWRYRRGTFLTPLFFYPKLCLHTWYLKEKSPLHCWPALALTTGHWLPHSLKGPSLHLSSILVMPTDGEQGSKITVNLITARAIYWVPGRWRLFIESISFNPHKNPTWQVFLAFTFYWWRRWAWWGERNYPKPLS